MRLRVLSALALSVAVLATTSGFAWRPDPSWQLRDTGSTARLRGLAPVSERVAWASGSGGTVLRTVDGGRSWQQVGPAGVSALDFRDIEAFDADHAVILSIGTGGDSRIYRTNDGGQSWTETFRNDDERAFYDCMAFFDRRHGLALSDPVDGKFRILSTSDGGRSWAVLPSAGMPAALAGEFAFAASGTCLVTADRGAHRDADHGGRSVAGHGADRTAWIATGGGSEARVFRTDDRGRTWRVTDTPVPSGPSAGIYTLAFRDGRHGIALGGDYTTPTSAPDGAAVSRDGGRSWTLAGRQPDAYRSGAAWVTRRGGQTALTVGPTGSDISYDGGRNWQRFDAGSFDSVECVATGACWASGERGRIALLRWR
ncbi:oxidoreductase [Micromonospora polyrhachis]|uniref:Photosystem II stability/assembly factor-like uncharacterized protein n=1 Tax=Micromonospora polyrhachis TaxID=1282883 RepID=A0A7W7SPJ5_9ACTN|nr:oxidoreductase [Micromonospora polyrhachis]MBB4958573.1 photosystem II stability/assembly factor-like uncharacterized protein [Micromonospora polyrhachis]